MVSSSPLLPSAQDGTALRSLDRASGRVGALADGARRQSAVLIAFGILCGLIAATIHPGSDAGPLVLGIGLLLAHPFYRPRLFIPGVVITLLTLANMTAFALPGGGPAGVFVLAAALAVGVVALAVRLRYEGVGADPVSPALLLGGIGLLRTGTAINAPATRAFYGFVVSWWLPAVVLIIFGIVYLARPLHRGTGLC